jgi:hypothetical protein
MKLAFTLFGVPVTVFDTEVAPLISVDEDGLEIPQPELLPLPMTREQMAQARKEQEEQE